jgi:hypothetical protein
MVTARHETRCPTVIERFGDDGQRESDSAVAVLTRSVRQDARPAVRGGATLLLSTATSLTAPHRALTRRRAGARRLLRQTVDAGKRQHRCQAATTIASHADRSAMKACSTTLLLES